MEATAALTSDSDSSTGSSQIHEAYGQIQLNLLKQAALVNVKTIEGVLPKLEQIRSDMKSLVQPGSPVPVSSYECEVDKAGESLVAVIEEITELQRSTNGFASLYRKTAQQRDKLLTSVSDLTESREVDDSNGRGEDLPPKRPRVSFGGKVAPPTPTQDPSGEEISASISEWSWTLEITNDTSSPMENFQSLLQHVNWHRRAPVVISTGSRVTLAYSGPKGTSAAVGAYRIGNKYAVFRFTYPKYYAFSFGFLQAEDGISLIQLVKDGRLTMSKGFSGNFSRTMGNLEARIDFKDCNYKYIVKVVVREA